MNAHSCTPFCGCYRPASVRWWHTLIRRHEHRLDPEDYCHFRVLRQMVRGGRSVEEMEALQSCHSRVIYERAGHRVTGEWCVCLSEKPPSAGDARGAVGGDGISALVAVKADLEHAADTLPISWLSTQRIFEAQQRDGVYRSRYTYYRRNLRVREIDRWLEPRDPLTNRPQSITLAYWLMSRALHGVRDTCDWPKPQSLVERDLVRKLTAELLVA